MFTVVDDHQARQVLESIDEGFERCPALCLSGANGSHGHVDHRVVTGSGRQVDPPCSVGERFGCARSHFEGKASLTHTAHADERHQSGPAEGIPDGGEFVVAADEVFIDDGQALLCGAVSGSQFGDGGEACPQQGVDLVGGGEAGELHGAHSTQLESLCGAVGEQACGCVRYQHCTGWAGRQDTRDLVHRRTEQVAIAWIHHPGVHRGANMQPVGMFPHGVTNGALNRGRCTHCGHRVVEHGDHSVTGVFEHIATRTVDHVTNHTIMQFQIGRHRPLSSVPPLRRTHDVGHHQRHQRPHQPSPPAAMTRSSAFTTSPNASRSEVTAARCS